MKSTEAAETVQTHVCLSSVCVRERERAREIKCVFGTVREQEGKCVMSSDGKRFRGALCVCVCACVCVCLFSPCYDLLQSMRTFISPPSLHGRGADSNERGLSVSSYL